MRRAALLPVVTAMSVTLSGCGFSLYNTPLPGGANVGSKPIELTVEFVDVLDLVPQSAVKVNDVSVGRVESVELDDWHAKVKILVNGNVHLPSNARAELLQTSLLGEKYVALEQPVNEAPASTELKGGDTIPLSRTGRNPEVEEVLGALSLLLNGGGLEQIRTIAHELNGALAGNESKVRDLLNQLNTFVGGLDKQKSEILTAIDSLNTLASKLNQQKQVLTSSLDTLPGGLKVLADEQSQLTNLLTSLSNLGGVATRVINGSEQNFSASLKELEPVLSQLAAAGQNLPNALELLTTYPFPRNVVNAIGGDYTNLSVKLDINYSDVLQTLTSSTKSGGTPGTSSAQQSPSVLPTLPGVGLPQTPNVTVPKVPGVTIPVIPTGPAVPGAAGGQ